MKSWIEAILIKAIEQYFLWTYYKIVWFQKNIHTPTTEGQWKAKIFKGKYEPKLEFPGKWGVQTKKSSLWGECGYFL